MAALRRNINRTAFSLQFLYKHETRRAFSGLHIEFKDFICRFSYLQVMSRISYCVYDHENIVFIYFFICPSTSHNINNFIGDVKHLFVVLIDLLSNYKYKMFCFSCKVQKNFNEVCIIQCYFCVVCFLQKLVSINVTYCKPIYILPVTKFTNETIVSHCIYILIYFSGSSSLMVSSLKSLKNNQHKNFMADLPPLRINNAFLIRY